jgi:3-dehydrosphinganine reductase
MTTAAAVAVPVEPAHPAGIIKKGEESVMKYNYAKSHVLVTGGSSGIGLAVAKYAASLGANVTIAARRIELLESSAQEIVKARSADTFVQTLAVDVSHEDEVHAALCGLIADRGLPDVVVNCAGITHPGEFTEMSTEIFRWNMDINYFGTLYVLKSLVPGMIRRRSGIVINISSAVGLLNVYGYTAYGASKYAVVGLSEALRMELKPHSVQVSLAIPADTNTPQLEYELKYKPEITKQITKVAGLMEPEEVAKDILDLAARGKYLILPGNDTKFLYTVLRLLGRAPFYAYFDSMIRRSLKRNPMAEPVLGCEDQTNPN